MWCVWFIKIGILNIISILNIVYQKVHWDTYIASRPLLLHCLPLDPITGYGVYHFLLKYVIRAVWYFEEGGVVLWRGLCGTLKRVVWCFKEGGMVLCWLWVYQILDAWAKPTLGPTQEQFSVVVAMFGVPSHRTSLYICFALLELEYVIIYQIMGYPHKLHRVLFPFFLWNQTTVKFHVFMKPYSIFMIWVISIL